MLARSLLVALLGLSLTACGIEAEGSLDGGLSVPRDTPDEEQEGGAGGSKPGGVGGGPGGYGGNPAGGLGGAGPGGGGPGGGPGAGAGGESAGSGQAGSPPAACSGPADCGVPQPCFSFDCVGGQCIKKNFSSGVSCDSDKDRCNGGCFCDGKGGLSETPASVIDDGDECTIDSCNPDTGVVVNKPKDSCFSCDSQNPCPTSKDPCNGLVCQEGFCVVSPLPKDTPCEDGDLCNGQETCDGGGKCMPGEKVALDDSNACTDDVCNDKTGEVQHYDIDCGQPKCDPLSFKTVIVECDTASGCKTREGECQRGLGCDGAACAVACQPGDPTFCQPGLVCNAAGDGCGKPEFSPCDSVDECVTGFCELTTDGTRHCTTFACGGCEVVGQMGCAPIPGGQDPKGACNVEHEGCTSKENCDGNAGCEKIPNGKACGPLGGRICDGGKCCFGLICT